MRNYLQCKYTLTEIENIFKHPPVSALEQSFFYYVYTLRELNVIKYYTYLTTSITQSQSKIKTFLLRRTFSFQFVDCLWADDCCYESDGSLNK